MKRKDYPETLPFRPRAIRFRAHRRVKPPCIRLGTTSRNLWVTSSAPAYLRHGQATYYLMEGIDYREFERLNLPTMLLAKVVCNLRNYYLQDQERTVQLIQKFFLPRSRDHWSSDSIRAMWQFVAGYTPWLGLVDEKAIAKQRKRLLEGEVVDLLAWTKPGGRVLDHDLLTVFLEWNPDLGFDLSLNLFSRAIKALTGYTKYYSDGKGYWVGFHIPTVEELEIPMEMVA